MKRDWNRNSFCFPLFKCLFAPRQTLGRQHAEKRKTTFMQYPAFTTAPFTRQVAGQGWSKVGTKQPTRSRSTSAIFAWTFGETDFSPPLPSLARIAPSLPGCGENAASPFWSLHLQRACHNPCPITPAATSDSVTLVARCASATPRRRFRCSSFLQRTEAQQRVKPRSSEGKFFLRPHY